VFEIGASLREARIRQDLDFPALETSTKIRGKYLQALEEERFEVLPGETYIKGFLRTYAETLGLDGQLYVDEFNSRYVAPEELQTIRARRTAQARSHRRMQGSVLVAALVGIAVVTALVIVAWTSGSPSNQPLAGVSSNNTPKQKQTHKKTTAPSTKRARITLRAVHGNMTLLAVHKGGPTGPVLLEGVELAPGEAKHFTQERLWINTGTPQNLRVIVNGKRVTYPGGKPPAFIVTAHGIFASA
jgi:cytoskeleton protein RodZ